MGSVTLKRQQNLDELGFTCKTYKSINGRRPVEQQSAQTRDVFTVWHLNIAGLKSKIDRLRTILHNSPDKPDIIGICETHLSRFADYGIPQTSEDTTSSTATKLATLEEPESTSRTISTQSK